MAKFSKKCGKFLLAFVATFALVLAFAFGNATTVNAEGENIFPNGSFEEEGFGWYANGGTPVLSTDEAHTGEKSLFVSGHWVRTDIRGDDDNPNAIFTELVSGVELGTIYNVSMWTKATGEGTTTLGASFILTVPSGESYAYPYVNLFNNGTMYFYTYNTEWTKHSSTLGFVREANNNVVALIDGVKVDLNSTGIGNINLDLGSNNGGSYFDDISIVKSSYTKNVTITLKDGADLVTGKTLIIKDANGVALENQPEIVEENGVYTVKGLTFNTLKDTYKYAVEGVNGLADGVITALESAYELGLSAYNATITVKDEEGNAITDATITANVAGVDVTVVNNGDGTYSINELFNAVNVKVAKDGLIEKTFSLTAENASADVVLKAIQPATEVVGNLIVNGNFESSLAFGSQEPGKWNAEAGSFGLTTNVQQNGVYGLEIGNRSAYRIDLGSIEDNGTGYVFGFAATGSGTITLDLRPTVTTSAGWGYPQVTLINAQALTDSFGAYEVEFAIYYDELEKTIKYAINGQETDAVADITGIAAIDFVFTASDGAVLDNVYCLETYDIEFTVVEEGNDVTEGLTFEVIGNNGALDVTPVYADGKWTINSVSGVVTVIVTNGNKTYPAAVFDSRNTTATIENGFDLTVTLVDNYGNAVTGAQIVARRGAVDLFTMVDNGDGTYTYSGALGSFNLYVTLEGYVFPVERNVTFENAEITITAESSPEQESENNSGNAGGSGCGSSIAGSLGTALATLFGAMGVVIFKKKEN